MKETELDIRLVSIGEVAENTHLYRWELMRLAAEPGKTDVSLSARLSVIPEHGMLKLRVSAHFTRMRGMVLRPLLDAEVEADFEIDEYERHFAGAVKADGRIDLPPSVLSLMLSVAVGGLRGIVAMRAKGTPLQSKPLPLINISWLMSRLIYNDELPRHSVPFSGLVIS